MGILKKLHKKPRSQVTQNIPKLGCCFFFNKCEFCFILEEEEEEAMMVSLSLDRCRRRCHICNLDGPSLVRKGPGPSTIPKNRVARKTAVPNFFPPDQKFRRKKSSAKAFRFRPEMDRTDNGRSNQLNRRPRVGRDGREVLPEFGRFEKNGGRIYF